MPDSIEIKLTDGDWTCCWIGDLYYKHDPLQGGITVASKVTYRTSTGEPTTIRSSVYNLYLTIAGSRLRVKNNFARSFQGNAQHEPKRQVYLFPITGTALKAPSSRLYRHLGLSGDDYARVKESKPFLRAVVELLQVPTSFGHSHAHCVPNTNPAYPVDYFLIPSYEVLRYFFLHGGRLAKDLLSYFTGKGEHATWSINELFAHPTGKPEIVPDGSRRVAALFVREGLTPTEIQCLARIAFVPEAYDCLNAVKDSLLLNSLEKGAYGYGKLETILPQNTPFDMAVCGQRFTWQDKNYLLVDQIYDTREELPFDQLMYMTLVDHRSQAVLPAAATTVPVKRPATPKTSPDAAHQRTDTQPGNAHQPADITDLLLTGYSFNQAGAPPIQVEKTGQTTRYQTTALAHVAQALVSLLEQAQARADAGRGKGHRRDTVHCASSDRSATALFEALGLLHGYRCSYFNLDREAPSFDYRFHLNRQRGLARPFELVVCRLEHQRSPAKPSVYLVWANAVRYGLFYAPALRQLSWTVLANLCNDYFGLKGVSAFGKEAGAASLPKQHVAAYIPRNQYYTAVSDLAGKIQRELDDIVDDNAAKLR